MLRRTQLALSIYSLGSWHVPGIMAAIGGTIVFASVIMFFVNLLMTVATGEKACTGDVPFAETVQPPASSGSQARLDALRYWVIVSVALSLGVYGPFLLGCMPPHLSILPLQYP